MVDKTAASLSNVVSGVQEITAQIEGITRSVEETRANIVEVSSATATLDQATRENVKMIDAAHQSVRLLDQETQTLNSEVSTFRIETTPPGEVEVPNPVFQTHRHAS